jgi:hypothetical protein
LNTDFQSGAQAGVQGWNGAPQRPAGPLRRFIRFRSFVFDTNRNTQAALNTYCTDIAGKANGMTRLRIQKKKSALSANQAAIR